MKKKIFLIISVVLVLAIGMIALGTALVIKSNSSYIRVDQTEYGFYIESKWDSNRVYFDEIVKIELKDTEYGNKQLDGIKYNNCEIGAFKDDSLGIYISFVYKNAPKSLVLELDSPHYPGRYLVIGLKSEAETNDLFNYINSNINK